MNELARTPGHLSVVDYFGFEDASDVRHEYIRGRMYAMVGASDRHELLVLNVAALLHGHVLATCQVFASNMRLRIQAGEDELYYYPDVLVSCDATDRHRRYREKPILLVEVLSPSTERIDRAEKLPEYKKLASVEEVVLMRQDAMVLEVCRRRTSWQREFLRADDDLTFEAVGLDVPVSRLYRGVDVDA
jgi:Uma2 family endonuclease